MYFEAADYCSLYNFTSSVNKHTFGGGLVVGNGGGGVGGGKHEQQLT